ncbi:MAG: phospholipase/carboxylesterase family protein, partial [Chitinophagaceae bacterium]
MNKLYIIALILSLTSCLDLDDNLYSPDKITKYKWDDYDGETEISLDDTYKIPDSLVYEFTLNSKDSTESEATKISAVYIGSLTEIATDTVIMYCHGTADHMDRYWQRAKLLANTGSKNRFGVLMIDYRGYGLSEGEPTEAGLYADVDAALQWLKDQGLSDKRLIYGYSLGSAPATMLAANPISIKPSKLILEAPFASAEVMVQDASEIAVPSSFVTNLEINNAEEIKKVKGPFLWIHGKKDDFLNIETHGEVVYKNYLSSNSIAYRVENANHTDVPTIMGFKEYNAAILDFLT